MTNGLKESNLTPDKQTVQTIPNLRLEAKLMAEVSWKHDWVLSISDSEDCTFTLIYLACIHIISGHWAFSHVFLGKFTHFCWKTNSSIFHVKESGQNMPRAKWYGKRVAWKKGKRNCFQPYPCIWKCWGTLFLKFFIFKSFFKRSNSISMLVCVTLTKFLFCLLRTMRWTWIGDTGYSLKVQSVQMLA